MADIHELGVRYRAEGQEQVKTANRDIAQTGRQAETATRGLEQAQAQSVTATRAVSLAQRQLATDMAQSTRAMQRFDLRGVSMQLSQVAQQTSATGQPLQALAIQLPDIGLAFGTVGIAAGVAAGALLPLAANFLDLGGATDKAEKAQEEWLDSLAEAEGSITRAESALMLLADSGLDKLRQRYGEVTSAVRELVEELAAIESRAAASQIGEILGDEMVSGIAAAFEGAAGPIAGAMLESGEAEIEDARAALDEAITEFETLQALGQPSGDAARAVIERDQELAALEGRLEGMGALAEQLGPSIEQIARVRELALAYDEALASEDFEAVADILREVREIAEASGVEIDQGIRDKMVEAEDMARQFVGRLEAARREADRFDESQLDTWMTGIAGDALKFADNMGSALGFGKQIAELDFSSLFQLDDIIGGGLSWINSATAMTPDPARGKTLSEAAERGILDLIAVAEGTAKGDGYNETLGYGAYTGGDVNLINMTLNEVLALQKQMLAHPDNSFNSSAVGRYQIVSITLRDMMKSLGLSGNEQFSPKMQDRLALEILRQQGVGAWEGMNNVSPRLVTQAMSQQVIPSEDAGVTRANAQAKAEADREAAKATREAEQAERERTRAVEQSQDAVDGLAASLDPLVAAEQEYADALAVIDDALKNQQITMQEAIAMRTQVLDEYQQKIKEIQDDLAENPAEEQRIQKMQSQYESLTSTLLRAAQAGENVGQALLSWVANAALTAGIQKLSRALAEMTASANATGGGGFWGSIIGAIFGGGFANGGAFQGGNVVPFANGGVVDSPQLFPMSGGRTGLMGEAGPEAIMPLKRINGKLGVAAAGGGGNTNVSMPINIDARGAVEGTAKQIAREFDRRRPQLMQDAVKATYAANRERPMR